MTQADAAAEVLERAGRPMHRDEIAKEIVRRSLPVWRKGLPGSTPQESVGRAITQEILKLGHRSRFEFEGGKGSGVFRLAQHGEGSPNHVQGTQASWDSTGSEAQTDELEWLVSVVVGATPMQEPAESPKTIEIRCDPTLLRRIDRQARAKGVTWAEMARQALQRELHRMEVAELERLWEEGYRKAPIDEIELKAWESVQDWGDPWEERVQ